MLHTQTRCRSVRVRRVTAGQKTVENQDWAAGRWAAGLFLAKPGKTSVILVSKSINAGDTKHIFDLAVVSNMLLQLIRW